MHPVGVEMNAGRWGLLPGASRAAPSEGEAGEAAARALRAPQLGEEPITGAGPEQEAGAIRHPWERSTVRRPGVEPRVGHELEVHRDGCREVELHGRFPAADAEQGLSSRAYSLDLDAIRLIVPELEAVSQTHGTELLGEPP